MDTRERNLLRQVSSVKFATHVVPVYEWNIIADKNAGLEGLNHTKPVGETVNTVQVVYGRKNGEYFLYLTKSSVNIRACIFK